ncbi:MAG TPA: zf-HC2 domain-containing protein [Gaiellaceae bacterium]|nr:zf-HC2 domain-containing protein [Gaiellaceae bacterium]
MLFAVHPSECDWAEEAASTRADGELLTELEHARLTAHLGACADCRMFAAAAGAIARELRGAPLEQPDVPVFLPRRHRTPALRVQAAAAALVATAVGASFAVGHVLGSSNRARTATGSSAADIAGLRADSVEQHLLAMLSHGGNSGIRFGTTTAL